MIRLVRASRLPVLLVVSTLLLTGCAEDIRLRNASTGKTAVCKGGLKVFFTGWGLQRMCVQDFQRAGYERVPD